MTCSIKADKKTVNTFIQAIFESDTLVSVALKIAFFFLVALC